MKAWLIMRTIVRSVMGTTAAEIPCWAKACTHGHRTWLVRKHNRCRMVKFTIRSPTEYDSAECLPLAIRPTMTSSRRFLAQQQGSLRLSQHRCRLPPPPGQTSLRLLYSAVRSRVLPAPAYPRILRTLAHKRGPFLAAMEPGRASDALPQKYGAAFF